MVINLSRSYYGWTEEGMEIKKKRWMSTVTLLKTDNSSWWASKAKALDVPCQNQLLIWIIRCGNCKIPSLWQTTNSDGRHWCWISVLATPSLFTRALTVVNGLITFLTTFSFYLVRLEWITIFSVYIHGISNAALWSLNLKTVGSELRKQT